MTIAAIDSRQPAQPSAALAIRPGQAMWDEYQMAALAQIGLKDASDADRMVFLHQCQRTGLDPFSRQIYMIGRNEKVPGTQNQWRIKWTIQTGIDGWRVIRDRAERRAGVRGTLGRAIWYDHDGNEFKVWVRRDPPAACEITYTVRDANGETPYTSVLQFAEYVQTKDSKPVAQWATKGSHMLEKCTEADVYRKAFPQDFAGVSLDDAMPPPEDAPAHDGRVTAADIQGRTRPQVRGEIVHDPTDASPAEQQAPAAGPPSPPAGPAGEAPTPDDTDYDTPGTAVTPQITAIWTILSTVFKFGSDEKDQARAVCAHIIGHELASTKDMSKNEAKTVLDTLGNWREVAEQNKTAPREFLIELMATAGSEATDA